MENQEINGSKVVSEIPVKLWDLPDKAEKLESATEEQITQAVDQIHAQLFPTEPDKLSQQTVAIYNPVIFNAVKQRYGEGERVSQKKI